MVIVFSTRSALFSKLIFISTCNSIAFDCLVGSRYHCRYVVRHAFAIYLRNRNHSVTAGTQLRLLIRRFCITLGTASQDFADKATVLFSIWFGQLNHAKRPFSLAIQRVLRMPWASPPRSHVNIAFASSSVSLFTTASRSILWKPDFSISTPNTCVVSLSKLAPNVSQSGRLDSQEPPLLSSIHTQDAGTSCKTTGECVATTATLLRSTSNSEKALINAASNGGCKWFSGSSSRTRERSSNIATQPVTIESTALCPELKSSKDDLSSPQKSSISSLSAHAPSKTSENMGSLRKTANASIHLANLDRLAQQSLTPPRTPSRCSPQDRHSCFLAQ